VLANEIIPKLQHPVHKNPQEAPVGDQLAISKPSLFGNRDYARQRSVRRFDLSGMIYW